MASLLSGIRNTSQSPLAQQNQGTRPTLIDQRLFEQTPLGDALDDLVAAHVPPANRPRRQVPMQPTTAHTFDSLNQYITSKQWRALALASQATIQTLDPQDRAIALKYWVYRILALVELGYHTGAQTELNRIYGIENLVKWPFELRLLRALIPGWADAGWVETIDRLCALLRGCRRALAKQGINEERRVLLNQRLTRLSLLIAGCALKLRDPALATEVLGRLAESHAPGDKRDPLLLSAVGRIHLQLGSIPEAERLFVQVDKLVDPQDKMASMNRGLFSVATGRWQVARDHFAMVTSDGPSERVAAENNRALCELYLGNPQLMIAGLQQLMAVQPTAAGTSEEIVFNYCSGLDLNYDGDKLRQAKAAKIVNVATWAGDAFDPSSFKM